MAVQKTKPLKDYTFYINDSLKYRKYSKVTYFECKFEASLFAYALKENFNIFFSKLSQNIEFL